MDSIHVEGKDITVTIIKIIENSYLLNPIDNINFSINSLSIGDFLTIHGTSIGKGTTSNIKKNGFKRGPETHGSKHHRLQGSLGAGTSPGRVFPGKKMPGKTGNKRVAFKNVRIIKIDFVKKLLYIKGSLAGKKSAILSLSRQ